MIDKKLMDDILSMDPIDKIYLVENILDSLDTPDPEIEKLWITESEARYEAFVKGLVKGVTLDEFEKRLEK